MAMSTFLATAALLLSVVDARVARFFFAFGGSYTTTGTDFDGPSPSPENPIGNPDWPGCTTSGGYNWVSHLVGTFNTSLILGWDFAASGATTDSSLIPPGQGNVPDMHEQIDLFGQHVGDRPEEEAQWTPTDSMFGMLFGINDVGNSFMVDEEDQAVLVGDIMESYLSNLGRLFRYGARNFLILNVPPVAHTPRVLGLVPAMQARQAALVFRYNAALDAAVHRFAQEHPLATVALVDTQAAFNAVLDHPADFGAPDNTCINRDGVSCLWWDGYHPGQAIHKLVAMSAVRAWHSVSPGWWRLCERFDSLGRCQSQSRT